MTTAPFRADALKVLGFLLGVMTMVLALVGLYAAQSKEGWAIFGGGSLLAIASLAVGALFGLLFGVPHASDKPSATSSTWGLVPNTSFDQISDWLTKILVGVGLTQLFGIPGRLEALATYLSPLLGGTSSSATLAISVLISSLVIGFIASFVWTKLVLSPDLADAGSATYRQAVAAVNRKLPPNTPLSPDQHQKAVAMTAELAERVRIGDAKTAADAGIRFDRVGAQALHRGDWDKLAQHAIHLVSDENSGQTAQ